MIAHPHPHTVLLSGGTVLDPEVTRWINDYTLLQTCDGADSLTLVCNGWDHRASQFRFLDDRVLFPGNKLELWAGYGPAERDLHCKGRFEIATRRAQYNTDGAVVTFVAWDALRKLMDNTQARVYQGFSRDSDVVEEMVRTEYGFSTLVYPSPGSRPPNALLESGTGKKMRHQAAVAKSKHLPGYDRTKPRGMTDLAWVKAMSEAYNWMYPRVYYAPARLGDRSTETFVWGPVLSQPDDWSQRFWWRGPNGQSDLLSFTSEFTTHNAPTGVELMGWDTTTRRPFRVRGRITESGIKFEWDEDVVVGEKVSSLVRNGAALRLSILGGGKQVVKLEAVHHQHGQSWNPEKEVPDVLASFHVGYPESASHELLESVVRDWLVSRLASWWTCSFEMANQPGLELLDSDQVHEFRGLSYQDEGRYITLEAVHSWGGTDHRVRGKGQKLIDGIPSMDEAA